jgi:hypothetical protein
MDTVRVLAGEGRSSVLYLAEGGDAGRYVEQALEHHADSS